MRFTLLFFRYYSLFSTFFSVLAGIGFGSAYNYKGITVNIFREISDRGFTIGNLTVISILTIIIKVVVIKEKFIIFEFIGN